VAAPAPADPAPPKPRATERVPVGAAVDDPTVTGRVDAAAPLFHRETPDEWSPALTDGVVSTYWAIDLGDLL
jgi:hypothetical protein